jgi:PAS domain S-box-containing protein
MRQRTFALRTTIIYIALAAAWVTLGDLLVGQLASDTDAAVRMQMLKGWTFVLLSGVFVYWLAHLTGRRWFTKHAELVAARQEFDTAERVAGVGHWIRRPGGEWVHWSTELFRIMGLNPNSARMSLMEVLERVHPEDRDAVEDALAAFEATGEALNDTHRIVRPSGEIRWVNVRGERVHGEDGGGEDRLTATVHDITDLRHAESELRAAHTRLDALTAHLELAREEERRRLAMDIHDVVGAGLSGVRMSLTLLARELSDRPDARARVDTVDNELDGIIATVRNLATDLRPAALDELGLVPALEVLADEWSGRGDCRVELIAEDEASFDMLPERAIQVYRIVQEALTNVARHASATRVNIRLIANRGRLELIIRDDGRGIRDGPPHQTSFGLANMLQRARLLGGTIDIRASRSGGTEVLLDVPLITAPRPGV